MPGALPTGLGKSRWTAVGTQNTEFTLVFLLSNYRVMYLYCNCKPTCAHRCMQKQWA